MFSSDEDADLGAGDDEDRGPGGEEFDDLGFALPPQGDAVGESARAYAQRFEPKAMRRRLRFEARLQKLPSPTNWAAMPKSALKGLLRKGLPSEHRREVWWSVLGCDARRQRSPEAYACYVQGTLRTRTTEEIERDLQRTFPNHRRFRTENGRGELRNVLRAFASHSPRVQYCQGLNFIAALLLVIFHDEERAFWAMVCAVESLGVEGYYTEGMALLRADMCVLTSVLEQKCPKVAHVFKEEGVDLTAICSEWYITWFARCLPGSTILRVWDTLFFEGFKVLFRIALGIFKRAESEVLQNARFDAIMEKATATFGNWREDVPPARPVAGPRQGLLPHRCGGRGPQSP
uniref:Rab-GAP TBC domain-containing protein n=1 Tax=Alexandrium monilatum TaxID=311494 RepID=A0A7S4QG78_9DINO